MSELTFDPESMRERIKAELKKDRRSQAEIARDAGLGHGYLTNILTRGQIPSVDKLDALCQELKVSISWIMYGEELPADFHRVHDLMRKDPKKFYALLALLE